MASNAKNLAEYLNNQTTSATADIADGSITTDKLAADAVTAAKLADNAVVGANISAGTLEGSGVNLGRRNILINGAFQHWQRGTSFSSNVYGADRWKFYAPGSHAYAQSTDTPDSPNNFKYSASCTGSGDATGLTQFVESINAAHIPSSGSTKVILSFYLKHTTNSGSNKITSSIGTLNSADNSGATTTRSTQNHNTTTSWARYTHEMTGADLTAAVTNGLQVTIKHNGSGNTVFLLTGCQLEINETVTSFELRSVGEELLLCQRYLHILGDAAATSTIGLGSNFGTGGAYFAGIHPVEMRAIPTLSFSDASHFRLHTITGGGITGITGAGGGSENSNSTYLIYFSKSGAFTSGGGNLCFNNASTNPYGTVKFDAEL